MAFGITAKVITIATAGTPTQVDSGYDQTFRLNLRNPFSNAGLIYFGSSTMTASARRSLERGEAIDLLNVNPAAVYVDVAVNGEIVECFWMI